MTEDNNQVTPNERATTHTVANTQADSGVNADYL